MWYHCDCSSNVVNFIELESLTITLEWVGSVWLSDPLCYAVNAHVEGFVTSCIWDRSHGTAGKRDSVTQLNPFET